MLLANCQGLLPAHHHIRKAKLAHCIVVLIDAFFTYHWNGHLRLGSAWRSNNVQAFLLPFCHLACCLCNHTLFFPQTFNHEVPIMLALLEKNLFDKFFIVFEGRFCGLWARVLVVVFMNGEFDYLSVGVWNKGGSSAHPCDWPTVRP